MKLPVLNSYFSLPTIKPQYDVFISYSRAADGKLAPEIQRCLGRLAKPFWKWRALRVFRDETTLELTPELWPGIQAAIASSRYFILLASPAAAASPWVQQEIEYWATHKESGNLLLALSDGAIVWDKELGDFDWSQTTALPSCLKQKYQSIPHYVDFTWVRKGEQITIRDPRFHDACARFAARIHEIPLDRLVGLDKREHERTWFAIWSTMALLVCLTIVAVIYAKRAETNATLAEERAKIARVEQLLAVAAQNFAEHERVLARTQAAGVGSDLQKALKAIAPKYLNQSKRYQAEAQGLRNELDVWRRNQGITEPIPDTLFTLEIFRAKMGTAFLMHYGLPSSPRRILIDGGPVRTYKDVLKPRLEALRTDGKPLQIDLVIATQTDIQHLQGLIDLVKDLQQQPADRSPFKLNAIWTNAFVPGPPEQAQTLVEIYNKGQLVAGARALGVPVNAPFSRMVAAPEAGVARVSFEEDLTITILGPRIQQLRPFADAWLREWQKRAKQKEVDLQLFSMVKDDDILETFADERIELRPSPIEIVVPQGGGGTDMSVVNLASTVLMLELSENRILLPADARSDTILEALGQGGYADEHGNVEVDVLVLPHGGSDHNVTVGFFQSVKARHYVFSGDGTYTNPEVATLKMLFDGRRTDKRPFSIALTYLPEEYKLGYPLADLYQLLRREKSAGTPFEIVVPNKGQTSFGIDLLSRAPFVDKGTPYVAPSL